MTDTLRERVARAIYDILEGPVADQDYGRQKRQWEISQALADAAIALVLEEAARVVTEHYQELCTEHRLLLVSRAAAIRALKEKSK